MEISQLFQEVWGWIVLYAPTVLVAIGTALNYLKMLGGLKKNKEEILNSTEVKQLKAELTKVHEEYENINSQYRELINREGELVNELSKVKKYENIEQN